MSARYPAARRMVPCGGMDEMATHDEPSAQRPAQAERAARVVPRALLRPRLRLRRHAGREPDHRRHEPRRLRARGADAGHDLVGVVGVRVDDERHRPQRLARPRSSVRASASSFFVALGGARRVRRRPALWFAIPYLAVRVLHLVVYVYGIRNDPIYQPAVLRSAPFWLVSPVIIVVGGFFDDPARTWIWLVGVALDIAGALIAGRQDVPRVGGALRGALPAVRDHRPRRVDRRHRRSASRGWSATSRTRVAAAVTFAGAALLWWAYFDFAGRGRRAGAAPDAGGAMRGKLARDVYTFLHFPMIAGIILVRRRGEEDGRASRRRALDRRPLRARRRRRASTCWASSASAGGSIRRWPGSGSRPR